MDENTLMLYFGLGCIATSALLFMVTTTIFVTVNVIVEMKQNKHNKKKKRNKKKEYIDLI